MTKEEGGEQDAPASADATEKGTDGNTLRELVRTAEPVESLPSTPSTAALDKQGKRQHMVLKAKYGNVLLWMMGVQLLVANGVFITYAWVGRHWDVESSVMQVWLAATVVQVIGVVAVVTRNLFPGRDEQA
jgi:hypothetical protein